MLAAGDTGCSNLITCAVAGVQGAVNGVTGAVSTVTNTVDFWSDPWGNTFLSLQKAAHGLAETVLPTLSKATMPDLSADWFLSAYAVSFAAAIFLAVVLLIPQFVRTARGQQSGRDLTDSVAIYFPGFMAGAMFGPVFGIVLVNFFGALTDVFTSWGVSGSADQITASMTAMLSAKDATGLAGGAVVGVLFMLGMIAGLLLVVLQLIVQLVTLYFTGVLLPLGLVWIIDPRQRSHGLKILTIWLGILAAHPLLFLLLGVAYRMTAANITAFSDAPGLQATVQLVVSVLAMLMAGLSPFVLMRLAPVLPIGAPAGGPSFTQPVGAKDMNEAGDRYGSRASDGGDDPSGTSSRTLTGDTGSAYGADYPSEPHPDAAAFREFMQLPPMGPGSQTDPRGLPDLGADAAATVGEGAAGAEAAEGMAAVGAAETSTGAGAVVGAPTLLAAAGTAVAAKAYEGAAALNEAASEAAATEAESYGTGSVSDV